jgi:ATP-binding cassette subfamily B protein
MEKNISAKQFWLYIMQQVKPFPLGVVSMFLAVFFGSLTVSVGPYFLKIILNRVANVPENNVFAYLAMPIAGFLFISLMHNVTYRLYNYLVEIQMVPRMRANIANHAMELLLNKDYAYFQNNFSGSLTNKVTELISGVPELIRIVIDRFFSHILTTVIAIITLWQVSGIFAGLLFAWNVVCISVMALWLKKLTRLADDWAELGSGVTGNIVDILSNISVVQLFAARRTEQSRLNGTIQHAVQAEQKLQRAYLWVWIWYSVAILALQILNFYFLCKGRQDGWISIGDFALVEAINFSFIEYIWWVAGDISRFSTLYGRITQALRAVYATTELQDNMNAQPLIVSKGEIVFSKVQFSYKDAHILFKDTSVTIQAGQKVGLVGYSGGGKSTFVNLILRLHDVTQGQILVDGQDIRAVTQESLRASIAVIPQDPSLFHRSLLENIRYGREQATDELVIAAAKRAHADEFISKLPQGYQSLVGERGVKLSGGQRQRVAIARAIVKNAPILMLDEATSQLDSITESYIQESLWQLMQGKTTIVIAHRLSTLLNMDRILVFDQGEIVQDGTHAELLAVEGLYKTLWSAQSCGFLPVVDYEE